MLISSDSCARLGEQIAERKEVYCKGLFLSARWFVLCNVAVKGTHVVILPDRDSAEYCAADIYGQVEGDIVFYLPDSGKAIERSNYKSSVGVQRTSAIGKLMSNKDNSGRLFMNFFCRNFFSRTSRCIIKMFMQETTKMYGIQALRAQHQGGCACKVYCH